jgi:hypothetical protein
MRQDSGRGSLSLSLSLFTFGGLQMSHVCTGTPFFALLTRPVMGVNLIGMSPGGFPIGRLGCWPPDPDA